MPDETASAVVDSVVYITDTIGGVEYQGSGVLIAPDEVLTAAHVVYAQGVGTATDIEVSAGYNAGSAPFGTVAGTDFDYEQVDDSGGDITEQQSQYDFAVIHLAQSLDVGTMSLDANYSGAASVTGYPASAGGAQVTAAEDFVKPRRYAVLEGEALGDGSSGGPVWIEGTNGPEVVGLVSSGEGSSGTFVQLTASDISLIDTWESEQGAAEPTACFAAGTRIATVRGDVAVQGLRIGDHMRLAGGGTAPVVWLGHRRVDCRRHPHPENVQPVRITAHAFGLGRPRRDIFLSPDHSVFVDKMLIPVRYLLNGSTVQQQAVASITYWHVELPVHDVLLAEGLPAESYLDTGNRGAFANSSAPIMAHPDFARAVWQRDGCAPLVSEGPGLDWVKRRLQVQATALAQAARSVRQLA
jgi:V8-like Glu-specific endopeptidase